MLCITGITPIPPTPVVPRCVSHRNSEEVIQMAKSKEKSLDRDRRRVSKAVEIGKRIRFNTKSNGVDVMTCLLKAPLNKTSLSLERWMVIRRRGDRYESGVDSLDSSCYCPKLATARYDAIESAKLGWDSSIYDLDADTLDPILVTKTTIALVKYQKSD